MLRGRRPKYKAPGEPEISGCFIPSASDRAFLTRVTKQTGIDQVFKTFDVDDAAGPPIGLMLIRNEGDAVVLYDVCRLWSPAGEARAVLVPTGTQDFGHFAYRRQAAMRHVAGLPARDLEAGFRRADRWYATLLQSAAVQAAGRECWIHVLGSTGGTVTSRCKPATSS